jgi:hypothetical protein
MSGSHGVALRLSWRIMELEVFFKVLSECARAHPPNVAPELVSVLETRSRAFFVIVAIVALEVSSGQLRP